MGIKRSPIATQNPRASSVVEQLVATFKAGVRRCMAATPKGGWQEALPDPTRGFCTLPSEATGLSPFLLQYKQYPKFAPTEGLMVDLD